MTFPAEANAYSREAPAGARNAPRPLARMRAARALPTYTGRMTRLARHSRIAALALLPAARGAAARAHAPRRAGLQRTPAHS